MLACRPDHRMGGRDGTTRDEDRKRRATPSAVDRERQVAAVARRQHGVITRTQLRGLGLTARDDERRLAIRYGISVTTPARTLLDLATVARERELEQAVAEAHAAGLARRARILSALSRHSSSFAGLGSTALR